LIESNFRAESEGYTRLGCLGRGGRMVAEILFRWVSRSVCGLIRIAEARRNSVSQVGAKGTYVAVVALPSFICLFCVLTQTFLHDPSLLITDLHPYIIQR
jgi:hypothetical protein